MLGLHDGRMNLMTLWGAAHIVLAAERTDGPAHNALRRYWPTRHVAVGEHVFSECVPPHPRIHLAVTIVGLHHASDSTESGMLLLFRGTATGLAV